MRIAFNLPVFLNFKPVVLKMIRCLLVVAILSTLPTKTSYAETVEASHPPQKGGALRLGWYSKPAPFDPFKTIDTISKHLMEAVFSNLIRLNPKEEHEPELAESWEVSKDGLTYTFYLQVGVKFHDGSEFTAEDALHTFRLIQDPNISPYLYKRFLNVQSWTAPSKYVLQAVLKAPDTSFIHTVTNVNIVSKSQFRVNEDGSLNSPTHPIGTGPFIFVDQAENGDIWLKSYPFYYEGAPYLDEIHLKIFPDKKALWSGFLRDEVDLFFYMNYEDYKEIMNNPFYRTFKFLSPLGYVLLFNTSDDALKDIRVRKAIAHTINRQEFIDLLEAGQAVEAVGPFHPNSWAFHNDIEQPSYAPEKAKELLSEAGFDMTEKIAKKDGKPLFLTVSLNSENDHLEKMARLLRQQLQELGIGVKFQFYSKYDELEDLIYREEISSQCHLFAFNSRTSLSVITHYWHPESSVLSKGIRLSSENRQKMLKILEEAKQEVDREQLGVIYKKLQSTMSENQMAIFLYFPYAFHAASSKVFGTEFLWHFFVPMHEFRRLYKEELPKAA